MYTDKIEEFIPLCNKRICFYSKDDPYIKLSALQDFAKSIQAKEIVYEKAGHFNEKAGYNTFDDILSEL